MNGHLDPQLIGLLSLACAGGVQLAGFSFLLGGLFQRMKSAEARLRELEKDEKGDGAGRTDLLVRVAQLETTVGLTTKQLTEAVAAVQREMHGLARQVAALTTQRRGARPPMADTLGD